MGAALSPVRKPRFVQKVPAGLVLDLDVLMARHDSYTLPEDIAPKLDDDDGLDETRVAVTVLPVMVAVYMLMTLAAILAPLEDVPASSTSRTGTLN